MTKEIKTKKDNKHTVVVRFEKDKWHKAIDAAFDKKVKDVSVSGFRKGKVPKDVYLKKFGKESLYMDAVDTLINEAYTKALADSKLIPIVKPNLDINSLDDDHVEFQFIFTTRPEVKVKKYKGLKVAKEDTKVTKDEIEHEMGHVLERFTEIKTKKGKIANGDVAVIDFEGFKGDVAFPGGQAENYELEIGSNSFIPGFEEGLIGLESGSKKDIKLSFPKDYHASDLAGTEVVFKVKVNEVKEKLAREFDESLFEDLAIDGVKSKKDLEAHIEKDIKSRKEFDVDNKHVDAILEAVAKNVEVDIPEELVDEESERLIARFQEQLSMQGVNLDLYYQLSGTDEKELKSQFEKEAYKNVLYRLMLEEIAGIEKIEVPKKEIDTQADELAKRYNMSKEEFLTNFGGTEMIEYDLKIRKVIDFLKEDNK